MQTTGTATRHKKVIENVRTGAENPTGKNNPKKEKKRLAKKRTKLQDNKKFLEREIVNMISYHVRLGGASGKVYCAAGINGCRHGKFFFHQQQI